MLAPARQGTRKGRQMHQTELRLLDGQYKKDASESVDQVIDEYYDNESDNEEEVEQEYNLNGKGEFTVREIDRDTF